MVQYRMSKKPPKPFTLPSLSEDEKSLFQQAMKGVAPLRKHSFLSETTPSWSPRKIRSRDETQQQTSPTYNTHFLANPVTPEEVLSYRHISVSNKSFKRLKQANLPIEARLDLHGKSLDEAINLTQNFIHDAQVHAYKCVLIVHGKGRYSPDCFPQIKNLLNQWLRDQIEVLAFHSAKPQDGGQGALYVLLKTMRNHKV